MDSTVMQQDFFKKLRIQSGVFDLLRSMLGYGQGYRQSPVLVRLNPEPGAATSSKPPVRIYVGTESKQYRAERLLVWSILTVRDTARSYEIYLMKDLVGFKRRGWNSAFSGYLYAIPALAEGAGRAIYNDVNQIYLNDPAELFDCDMQGAAVLGCDDHKTSVMLLDCHKLSALWTLQEAKEQHKPVYFDQQVHALESWGLLPSNWNADDLLSEPVTTNVLYCVGLADQSRQTVADMTQSSASAEHSLDEMERAADNVHFTLFTEDHPSARYQQLLGFYETMHEVGRPETGHDAKETFSGVSLTDHIDPIAHLVKLTEASTILDFGSGKGKLYQDAPGYPENSRFKNIPSWGRALVTCYDPGYQPFSEPVDDRYDVVISTDVVEHIPEEDIAWVLDKIFAYATQALYVVAACYPAQKHLPDGTNAHCTLQPPEWWVGQMQQSAHRHPTVNWTLCTQEKSMFIFQNRKKLRKKGMRNRFFSGNKSHCKEHRTFDTIEFQAHHIGR
jgi:hypothetical protein